MEEDQIFGEVYEEPADGWFRYNCEYCATSYTGPNRLVIEDRADSHEKTCHTKPYRYK